MGGRKIDRGPAGDGCPVRRGPDGTWRVTGYEQARTVLRSGGTVQAGLGIETVEKLPARFRRPVLYRDGPEHREHRRQTARFFTPRRVSEHYRDIMVRVAGEQLARLTRTGRADLPDLAFGLAIGVAAEVIGLTESRPGIQRRLDRFFPEKFGRPGFTSLTGIHWFFRQMRNWLAVYVADVRPAVRARRRDRRDDLISHLLDEGCSAGEILGECLTFAAAGMVTTREFVSVAAWHLFTDDDLRTRYRAAGEDERVALLHEILRTEPVIGGLKRRTTEPLRLDGDTIPAGELVELRIDAANLEPCEPPGLSFGDGAHKCPGAHIAILEADVFLSRLFALPGLRMATPPRVTRKAEIDSYELRNLVVTTSAPD
ncbi:MULTISPECIES: cytochrome P450 [Amycolatopsis]|uniref:cytochrome P450 n=1 Tax=Amycolatopsis TaxID=1813 RepID=UPI000B8A9EBF|nr:MULTISPECIES: cytochrome P450 [Amycolatopsis]OXM63419.1 cytochrome [Amycolatopsis sp. KNN50.9b]